MDKAEVATRIRTFLEAEYPDQGTELTDTTNLLEDWFVDSFGIIEIVMFLEKSFGLKVARADINGSNFGSIELLSEFVAQRLGAVSSDG